MNEDAVTTVPGSAEETAVVLNERELLILRLVAEGYDNTEISRQLHFGVGTIKLHIRGILVKMNATSRTEAAVKAVRLGLI